jgi:hypothetical protein
MKANATTLLKTGVANAVKTALSAGAGTKKLQVYSGTIPETAGAAVTTQVKLLEFTIDPASWSVTNGELIVPSADPVDALATGVARWARFINGDDAVAMDADVTSVGGNGFVRLTTTSVVSGTPCGIIPGKINL